MTTRASAGATAGLGRIATTTLAGRPVVLAAGLEAVGIVRGAGSARRASRR